MIKKYAVHYHKKLNGNIWEVGYAVWEGCACNRIKRKALIQKERMPLQSDVIRWDQGNYPD